MSQIPSKEKLTFSTSSSTFLYIFPGAAFVLC